MLGVILINYHSEEEAIKFIKNELCHIQYLHKIVIVNNTNSDESQTLLENKLKELELYDELNKSIFIISKNENLGYARANNFGAEFLKEKFNPKYLLFSNTDIVFTDKIVVDSLIEKLNQLPDDFSVIGPRVFGLDGLDQSPHYEISFKRYFLWNTLPFLRGKLKFLQKKKDQSIKNLESGPCYWVSGCFFIAKSKDFFQVGMFDEYTFLYGEEKMLSERLLREDKKNYFFSSVSLFHEHGSTTKKHIKNRKVKEMIFNNECYYYRHYKKTPKFFINLLRLVNSVKG